MTLSEEFWTTPAPPYSKGQLHEALEEAKRRIEQLEAERDSLAAQNEAMREALEMYFNQYPHMMKGYILDALNLPNLATEVLKRRDVAVLRRAAKHYEYEWGISSAGYDLLKMAADIEKETT